MTRSMAPLDMCEMEIVVEEAGCNECSKLSSFECPNDALHEPDPEIMAEDDVSGEALDVELVRAARKEEIAYSKSMRVYKTSANPKVSRHDRKAAIGRALDRHEQRR